VENLKKSRSSATNFDPSRCGNQNNNKEGRKFVLVLTLKAEGRLDLDFGKSKQQSLKSSQSATNGFRSCQEFDLHLEKIRETFASLSDFCKFIGLLQFGRIKNFVSSSAIKTTTTTTRRLCFDLDN
jgi:hypothetical protein